MGNNPNSPNHRNGTPRGINIQTIPNRAAGNVHAAGACCCQVLKGHSASHCKPSKQSVMIECASCSGQSIGKKLPNKVSGTTTRLINGIATALATGEMTENC